MIQVTIRRKRKEKKYDLKDSKENTKNHNATTSLQYNEDVSITTTTVRRTISSTVPNLTSGYSTTTVVLFQIKYKMSKSFDMVQLVVLHQDVHKNDDDDRCIQSGISTYGENLLFRLTVQGEGFNDDNDDSDIIPVRVPHDERMIYNNNTIAITRLVVLYQDTYHAIAIISSLDTNKILNGEYYSILSKEIRNTTEDLIDSFSKDALTNDVGIILVQILV